MTHFWDMTYYLNRPRPSRGYFWLITTRIRRMGNVIFSVCLSVHTWGGGGLPWLGQDGGGAGYPYQVQMGGGYPSQVQMGGGTPARWVQMGGGYPGHGSWMGYPFSYPGMWGTPSPARDEVPPPRDGVTPPPRDRTADWVIDTRWAVCLLRSRRRTLFWIVV